MVKLLSSPFSSTFQDFVENLDTECLICSPYITSGPVKRLIAAVQEKRLEDSLSIKVITDISARNLLHKSTDLTALLSMMEHIQNTNIIYLPKVHAKVFVTGSSSAIVGSANFTDGGSFANLEYGVRLDEPALVRRIKNDLEQYAELGGNVTQLQLRLLGDRVEKLRVAIKEEQRSMDEKFRTLSVEAQRDTEDELIKVRVRGRSVHAIFAETILYLLARQVMTTTELHEHVREIHPDLCNDTIDRVIDGQRFGRLWKHQVRTAQQHLKRQGLVLYDANHRTWRLST